MIGTGSLYIENHSIQFKGTKPSHPRLWIPFARSGIAGGAHYLFSNYEAPRTELAVEGLSYEFLAGSVILKALAAQIHILSGVWQIW